jgi:FeS assembly SUF system protein
MSFLGFGKKTVADDTPGAPPDSPMAQAGVTPDATAGGAAKPALDREALTETIIQQLQTVFDPEIPVNIYELGLIYSIVINDDRSVEVTMTLTAPGCPVAEEMPLWVRDAVMAAKEVEDVHVDVVWDPPWDPSLMSEAARLELGFM